jgi:hypothetical protein
MQVTQLLEWAKNVDPANPRQFLFEDTTLADQDTVIIREARECERIEYAAATLTGGAKRGLIVIGHIPSEPGGMINCATRLEGFISKAPIRFVAAAAPFWSPSAPSLFSI